MNIEREKLYKLILVELEEQKNTIELEIKVIQGLINKGNVGTESAPKEKEQEGFFGIKPRVAAAEFLRIKKEPQTAREIAEGLLEGGMETKSLNFNNYMHQILVSSIDAGHNIFVKKKYGNKSKFSLRGWSKK